MNLQEKQGPFEYSSLQIDMTEKYKQKVKWWVNKYIDPNDLYPEEGTENGVEVDSHITLLYGIHTDNIKEIVRLLKIINLGGDFKFSLTNVSYFRNDDKEYDVLKIDVEMNQILDTFRKRLKHGLENTQTFNEYHPHLTLCYLKKGTNYNFSGFNEVRSIFGTFIVKIITFSSKTGKIVNIRL